MKNFYRTHLYPRLEWLVSLKFNRFRKNTLSGLQGTVLEPGIGHGLNLAHYPPEVRVVIGADPNPGMKKLLALARRKSGGPQVIHHLREAEHLPEVDSASADAAVLFLTLCSVSSPEKVLSEVRRILKPGAELRFFEHVEPEGRVARKLASWFHPVWVSLAAGCHLNRRTELDLVQAGFEIKSLKRRGVMISGIAVNPVLPVAG
ncbi:MAG: class I SAM-dependent methyltransferase [Bacteroidetes bacterium]|nr:class I SAM-dependent methyltransferase [Bacteroidota bacterium]